jgi:hypothetical protein
MSPTCLPISERAIGDAIEINPVFMLASNSPTIWYVTSSSKLRFKMVTVAPKTTLSVSLISFTFMI